MKVTDEMVTRFLCWKLPEHFNPDGGISFVRDYNQNTPYPAKHEPIGTNLFTADQAREMLEHVLASDAEMVEAYALWSNEMYIREEGQVGVLHGRLFDTLDSAKSFYSTSEPYALKNGTFVKIIAEATK